MDVYSVSEYAVQVTGIESPAAGNWLSVMELESEYPDVPNDQNNNTANHWMSTKLDALEQVAGKKGFQRIRLSQSIVAGSTALLDALLIAGSGFLIHAIYVDAAAPGRLAAYAGVITTFTLLALQSFSVVGLYRFIRIIHPAQQLFRLIMVMIGAFSILLICAFALKISDQFSRIWAFSWLASCLLLVPAGRFAVTAIIRRMAREGRLGRNIIIYGAGKQGAALIRHIESMDEPWNRIVGVFDDRATRGVTEVLGHPVIGDLKGLVSWARNHRTDEILIALPWGADERLMTIAHMLSVLPADIRLSPEFVGADFFHRRASFQYGVPMLSIFDTPVAGWPALLKTAMDFTLGSLFLLMALPVMTVIAIAIKLDSPGPILFRQKRCGFNNQLIDVFKFRTMYVDKTDHDADRLVQPGDPRVTRVGAFLRRFSLDELPQLFNVLSGEMSVVGPRPHALKAKAGDALYEDVVDEYAVRHKVKPGITGWAQVNGWRGNTETEADIIGRVEHDLYYIENWSVLLDLIILVRTVFVVIRGENSY